MLPCRNRTHLPSLRSIAGMMIILFGGNISLCGPHDRAVRILDSCVKPTKKPPFGGFFVTTLSPAIQQADSIQRAAKAR